MIIKFLTSSPFNVVVNNLFWAGCVIGRYDFLWLVLPAILCYVALLVFRKAVLPNQLLVVICIGVIIDSVFTVSGIFQFEQNNLFLPLWMGALWIAFATTLPMSLKLLGRNAYVAAATGAIGFPFSYFAGEKLGAVSFSLPPSVTLLLVACTWAIALPLMYHLINRPRVIANEAF